MEAVVQDNAEMNANRSSKTHNQPKILFFTTYLGGGGAEMQLLRVMNHLDRNQFQAALALMQSGGSYESALAADVRVHAFEDTSHNLIRLVQRLQAVIQQEQPDIVCSALDLPSCVAILAARTLRQRPKVVVCVQAPPSLIYRTSSRLSRWGLLQMIRHLFPWADRVLAISQGVEADLLALSPAMRPVTQVVYNAGVDAHVLQGAQDKLPSDRLPQTGPLIVACGRLAEQKGFPDLIHALAQVRQTLPAQLWIVGEGKQRQALEAQIQALGLTNSVQLLGQQDNPYQYMAAADLFVLSSHYEGFGNVIVEAMACGTPVVSTDCPHGPAEIITHEVNGLLVPPGDVPSLAQAILRVLTDPDLQQRLSRNGQLRAQDFRAETITAAYAEVFRSVLDHPWQQTAALLGSESLG